MNTVSYLLSFSYISKIDGVYCSHLYKNYILPEAPLSEINDMDTLMRISTDSGITHNYINDDDSKNRSLIPLDLNIMVHVGPYKFNRQATANHQGRFMTCGRYTVSTNLCGKTFYCLDAFEQN